MDANLIKFFDTFDSTIDWLLASRWFSIKLEKTIGWLEANRWYKVK